MPTEGRATLAHSYRNLSERDILARLDGTMSDAERVTAKAELLRRRAGDTGPDTTLATGFAPTSTFDVAVPVGGAEGDASGGSARARVWPWLLLLMAASGAGLGWAIHARLIRI